MPDPGGFTQNDLIDVVVRHLEGAQGELRGRPSDGARECRLQTSSVRGRVFLTEYVIKKTLTPGAQHLTIPKDAIVSPLAQDWLELKGIEIVRSA